MTRSKLAIGILAFAMFALTGRTAAASAHTVDSVGDSFIVNYSGNSSGGLPLSATLVFTVTSFDTGTDILGMSVLIDNTSTTASELSGFGFNTDPNATGGDAPDALFTEFVLNGPGDFEVCIVTSQNCNGAGPVGVSPDDPAYLVNFTINFTNLTVATGVTFDNFGTRFQSVGPNGQDSGKVPEGGSPPGGQQGGNEATVVPEPASLLLLGSGLGLVATKIRRRRTAKA